LGEGVVGLRVLVADGDPLGLASIRGALAGMEDIEIVGEANSSTQLLPLISRASPDVVLLDLHMPDIDGLLCLQRIRAGYPEVKVIVVADVGDPVEIVRVLDSGACAYILKSIDPFDLAAAIRQAVQGTFYSFGSLPLREVAKQEGSADLSAREIEVLQRAAAGLSNRAIAKELWLSDQTVKFHLQKIYRKLGVTNRTEAAGYAYRRGLPGALG
jgi:DNA-binding NarL/FixJ family response regulator